MRGGFGAGADGGLEDFRKEEASQGDASHRQAGVFEEMAAVLQGDEFVQRMHEG
jgi:hypothetical protein